MKVDPKALDQAAERMKRMGEFRTTWRITRRLLLDTKMIDDTGKAYARTWLGALPVYLGKNRMWVPVHSWLFSRPRALCSPKKKRLRREIDARLAVPPGLISVKEVDHDTQTVGPIFRV